MSKELYLERIKKLHDPDEVYELLKAAEKDAQVYTKQDYLTIKQAVINRIHEL